MGDPRKQRKKYEKPLIPWDEKRIDDEREAEGDQAEEDEAEEDEEEKGKLLEKCKNLGLIDEESLDNVLKIELRDILERRLQTVVSKLSGVQTAKQARQFIVHGHVRIGGRRIETPSFLVPKEMENEIEVNKKVTEVEN
ncbi:MAG: 30S ribosomal protein S4 [Candidatus Aenigmatarchaeota archaeon]